MPPAAAADSGSTPVPVPNNASTQLQLESVQIRRRSPVQTAVKYDGSNAVQLAAWLLAHGRRCQVSFSPDAPPKLMAEDGTPVPQGWVLSNLEVLGEQDLTTIWEKVPNA